MATQPASATELEGHDGMSLADLPFWERLMAEYMAIGQINGFEFDSEEHQS